ncbi:LysR family transcriptional regulator [Paraburkholderia silviterrae]|nr:LysR family transcriptional regulator [Paraburkholderia silviterrae]
MDNFDLNLLRVFDALQRHGHLGKAAVELNLSQPATSYALKRLREELGDALFVKTRSGMQPTPRAMQLAPVVQSVLADIRERVLTAPNFEPDKAQRTFNLAMSDVGEMVSLPKLLQRVTSLAPSVNVNVVSLAPKQLLSALQRSEVDLAIGYFPDLDGVDVFQQRLVRHSFVCLVRKEHPAAQGRLTKKLFCELPHAVVQAEGRRHEIVEQFLKEHGIQRRELLHTPHFLSIPMTIAMTDLVVTVSSDVGEIFSRIADLAILEPPYRMPHFDVKQHWHRSQHDDPGNRWLRGLVHELFVQRAD